MKNFAIIQLILIIFVGAACNSKPKGPTHLKVGKQKLIDNGNAIEAIELLVEAEKREEDKTEPRALLLIAYSYGLSSGAAKAQLVEPEYKKQRKERIAALNNLEMEKMLEILNQRSVVQQEGFNALADKGTEAAYILINNFVQETYPDIQKDILLTLEKIGPKAIDPIIESISNSQTAPDAKMHLVQVLAEIDDAKLLEKIQSIDLTNYNDPLKMTVYTTLYRLGDSKYKANILNGLISNEVEVRRAAAKAMKNLKNVDTEVLISSLKDTDSQVVADVATALSVHTTKAAVDSLKNILKSEHDATAKKAAIETLKSYAETGGPIAKGWAKDLANMLIEKQVPNPTDRLRIVQLLKHPTLVRSLKAAKISGDLGDRLYKYFQNDEDSDFVKTELNQLLSLIG